MWTLIFGYHEDRTSTHGYEATREAAHVAAFAKSWRRRSRKVGPPPGCPALSLRSPQARFSWGCTPVYPATAAGKA
jgi:hypothetical protein